MATSCGTGRRRADHAVPANAALPNSALPDSALANSALANAALTASALAASALANAALANADGRDVSREPERRTRVESPDPGVSWRPHLNLANAVTAAGFAAAIVALLIVVSTGAPVPAGWRWAAAGLVIFAAGADLVDGTLARHYGTAGPFGHGLDTISDVVSFGVTPGVIAYCVQLYRHPVPGTAAIVVWCIAVQWRLARYLVRGHQRAYVGCPCPLAAVILVIMLAAGAGTYPVLAVMVVLSGLMVSSLPVPTWPDLVRAGRASRPVQAGKGRRTAMASLAVTRDGELS
jgi:CDP-diacylglycerol--serine O-phosphatidyltransferase